jgi:agmatinase
MKTQSRPFLGLDPPFADLETSAAVILPFPYEGGISCGSGAAAAPAAVLESSHQLELYDEVLRAEPYLMGIATVEPPAIPHDPKDVLQTMYDTALQLLERGKFVAVVGGDHSPSSGFFRALRDKAGARSVIQLDAHADLRESYEGSPLSHACAMARMRELTRHTLQLGIRSMSSQEAEAVSREKIALYTMTDLRHGDLDLASALDALPDPVFVTVDADVFDWGIVASTGTPEPGGLFWDEALDLLHTIFLRKHVVGFDVVELAFREGDPNSPFAVAKLVYRMLGFKLESEVRRGKFDWPRHPAGSIFRF